MSDQPALPAACFICRCEEIAIEEIDAAFAAGAATVNDVKRRTRAGMGLCQGVYCLAEIARLLAERGGRDLAEFEPMTSRPPARLLSLGELAALER